MIFRRDNDTLGRKIGNALGSLLRWWKGLFSVLLPTLLSLQIFVQYDPYGWQYGQGDPYGLQRQGRMYQEQLKRDNDRWEHQLHQRELLREQQKTNRLLEQQLYQQPLNPWKQGW